MLPNLWYPVLRADEVGTRPLAIRRMGVDLVVFRRGDGGLACLLDRCPHRGVKLSLGDLSASGLRCRYHGLNFNTRGECTELPCDGADARIPRGLSIPAFTLREAFGHVWLWWGSEPGADGYPPIPLMASLPSIKHDHGFGFDWPQSFIRSVETNFDPYHTPWAHRPLTRRIGSRVGDIECTSDATSIDMKGMLLAEAEGKRNIPFRIRFALPSIAYLELGDILHLLVLDCAIDNDSTRRYVQHRTPIYQTRLGSRLAKVLVPLLFNFGQRQDLRLVSTQRPRRYEHGTDKFLRADVGITRYHALRKQSLEKAWRYANALPPWVRAAMSESAGNEPILRPIGADGCEDLLPSGSLLRVADTRERHASDEPSA